MQGSQRRATVLLWSAIVAFGLAVLAVALPVTAFARAASRKAIPLDHGVVEVVLPADQRYGLYFDDTDNSGYSEDCTVLDADGTEIPLNEPGFTMSSSDTESLDFVFNTGSGRLRIGCSSSAERVTVKPVPSFRGLLGGLGLAALAACLGGVFLVLRARGRSPRPLAGDSPYGWTVGPAPAWYPDPSDPSRLRYWDGRQWTEHVHP